MGKPDERIERTMAALMKNRMEAYFVETRAEVVQMVGRLLHEGDTVSCGGSVTLAECGVLELLADGDYEFLDRNLPGLSPEEIGEVSRDTFYADAFVTSTNAVTENGELYNTDGNANRVAAMAFGPASVIIVAGKNKIVPDLHAAAHRVKTVAAPLNAKRLSCNTPCALTGECCECTSPARICCTTVIHRYQRIPGRIKVILVGEDLGY
ncbi:MAG: lactate utilization protein [Pygmaiobacter sp.]